MGGNIQFASKYRPPAYTTHWVLGIFPSVKSSESPPPNTGIAHAFLKLLTRVKEPELARVSKVGEPDGRRSSPPAAVKHLPRWQMINALIVTLSGLLTSSLQWQKELRRYAEDFPVSSDAKEVTSGQSQSDKP